MESRQMGKNGGLLALIFTWLQSTQIDPLFAPAKVVHFLKS